MTIPEHAARGGRWAFVVRGEGGCAALVWVYAVRRGRVVYRAPNPWAFREADRRKGWNTSVSTLAELALLPDEPAATRTDDLVRRIGPPPAEDWPGRARQ